MPNFKRAACLTILVTLPTLPFSAGAADLAPTFAAVPAQTVAEGQSLSFSVSATDPEGSAVTITAKNLKTWMTFSNKVLTATPGLSNSGTYTVTFTALDSLGKAATLSVPITVTNTNQAPTLGALISRTVAEGGSVSFGITATDADKDAVTISASPLKPWMSFSGTTFTATPGYGDSGTYQVTVTASDGKLSSQQVQTITVTDVNQAPVFGAFGNFTVAEGGSLTSTVTASDADGSPVTITASGLQTSWMSFDGAKFTATPDYAKAGSYPITFTASDGVKQTKSTATLVVTDTNRAPVLAAVGARNVGEGYALSLPITATDEDGDSLTLTASGLQSWMSFDGRTFRARPVAGMQGSYNVTFSASDGKASDSETSTITVTLDDSAFPPPWTAYFGSQNGQAKWAGWQRAWLSGVTGLSLVDNPSLATDLSAELENRLQAQDVMIPIYGFDGGGGTGESLWNLMDMIADGDVATWKAAVKAEIAAAAQQDPTGLRVYYQMGNEISRQTLDQHLRDWAASRGIEIPGEARDYDPEFISYYVEYYVAPTVEAAREAGEEQFGNSDAVIVALGSIGSGGSTDARAWLDQILDYQVQGTYAPGLAGKKVSELVDLITVHYVGPYASLAAIWDKWAGVGRITGLWTTEEIGGVSKIGLGAGKAVSVTGNHLGWYYQRGFSPLQTRVNFYAWDEAGSQPGTAADESMSTFYTFFGDTPLEVFYDGVAVEGDTGGTTYYRYNSVNDDHRRVVSVVPSPSGSLTVQYVTVSKEGWSGSVEATAHKFSSAGHTSYTATVTDIGSSYRISLPSAVSLSGGGDAMMITLLKN